MSQTIYLLLGHAALALGALGLFLPVLPTTPFLLLATYLYSRGSPHFHRWLVSHPRLGPPIARWQQYGAIGKHAKMIATASILISLSLPLLVFELPLPLYCLVGAIGLAVLAFILSRPSGPRS